MASFYATHHPIISRDNSLFMLGVAAGVVGNNSSNFHVVMAKVSLFVYIFSHVYNKIGLCCRYWPQMVLLAWLSCFRTARPFSARILYVIHVFRRYCKYIRSRLWLCSMNFLSSWEIPAVFYAVKCFKGISESCKRSQKFCRHLKKLL